MLHWQKDNPNKWSTDEARDDVPDFVIDRIDLLSYRLKMRSARLPKWFSTLDSAKRYAERTNCR